MHLMQKIQQHLKIPSIEYFPMLQEFVDVFQEVWGPPKRDIDFSIDLVVGITLVSKAPYRMGTPELKKLQI